MNLNFLKFPESQPMAEFAEQVPVIIIPGLFGSVANWRSFARRMAESQPVIVIDQRNHGDSPHAASHTYADMVADLLTFCDLHGLQKVSLCGHSMGGKVAMLFALAHADRVQKLMVLDIAPTAYGGNHADYLHALLQLDLAELPSRGAADRMLQTAIPDTATRMFLLQSLTGSKGNHRWRINIPVLLEFMPQIGDFPEVRNNTDLESLFVNGTESDYVLPAHHPEIKRLFPNADFSSVADAGHWLHADQPDQLLDVLLAFLNDA